jgi:hypothetical protein
LGAREHGGVRARSGTVPDRHRPCQFLVSAPPVAGVGKGAPPAIPSSADMPKGAPERATPGGIARAATHRQGSRTTHGNSVAMKSVIAVASTHSGARDHAGACRLSGDDWAFTRGDQRW